MFATAKARSLIATIQVCFQEIKQSVSLGRTNTPWITIFSPHMFSNIYMESSCNFPVDKGARCFYFFTQEAQVTGAQLIVNAITFEVLMSAKTEQFVLNKHGSIQATLTPEAVSRLQANQLTRQLCSFNVGLRVALFYQKRQR